MHCTDQNMLLTHAIKHLLEDFLYWSITQAFHVISVRVNCPLAMQGDVKVEDDFYPLML